MRETPFEFRTNANAKFLGITVGQADLRITSHSMTFSAEYNNLIVQGALELAFGKDMDGEMTFYGSYYTAVGLRKGFIGSVDLGIVTANIPPFDIIISGERWEAGKFLHNKKKVWGARLTREFFGFDAYVFARFAPSLGLDAGFNLDSYKPVRPALVNAAGLTAADVAQPYTVWSGACSGNGACQLTMNGAKSVAATFTPIPTYALTVQVNGGGSVSGQGIACGADCTESYPAGTVVKLNPVPAQRFVFNGWSGACTGAGVWVGDDGKLYLTSELPFTVNGGLSGDSDDVIVCAPSALSVPTTCTFTHFWDGAAQGFTGGFIDGLDLHGSLATVASADQQISEEEPADESDLANDTDVVDDNAAVIEAAVIEAPVIEAPVLNNFIFLPVVSNN